MATLKDIARETGVSISTASRALRSIKASEEVILKVKEAARRLNYSPDLVAQGLVTKTTRTIGLIVPDITNPYFSDLSLGLETYLREVNWTLILCNSDDFSEREEVYLNSLISRRVDGIIIASTAIKNGKEGQAKEIMQRALCPIVAINSQPEKGMFTIQVDSEACGHLATKHLIETGKKDIAIMIGSSKLWKSRKRIEGFKQALKEHGLNEACPYIEGGFRIEDASRSFSKLIDQGISIDGIVCESDLMAIGVLNECKKRKVSIPNKIGIVGSGLTFLCDITTPKLTSVGLNGNFLGKEVGKFIINALKDTVTPFNTSFEPQIHIGESTKAAN